MMMNKENMWKQITRGSVKINNFDVCFFYLHAFHSTQIHKIGERIINSRISSVSPMKAFSECPTRYDLCPLFPRTGPIIANWPQRTLPVVWLGSFQPNWLCTWGTGLKTMSGPRAPPSVTPHPPLRLPGSSWAGTYIGAMRRKSA